MKNTLYITIGLLVTLLLGSSCVTTKEYNSARADAMRYESGYSLSKQRAEELRVHNATLAEELEKCHGEIAELDQKYKRLLSDGSAEASRVLRQLEQTQREMAKQLERVEEMEQMLSARESAIEDIRKKVAGALVGFDGRGLSISTKEGKVYVSMDEKLLFKSGSYQVDPKGAEAVKKLGVVLAANPDINIMVEGHTDDVPYRESGGLKDNLDLSAMRATTVTRLLLENKEIDPVRIISSGRGEYLPVAQGKDVDSRALNRRTEIILSPKLDELMQLLDR